jgi:hypothetical protein
MPTVPEKPPYLDLGALSLCLVDRATLQWVQDAAGNKRLRVKAVGAVANKMYKSGRIIPVAVQKDGLQRTADSGRQLTAFIEHPGWMDGPGGDVKECAAIVVDGPTLDVEGRTHVTFQATTTPAGALLGQLLESGVELGVSQRALGKEEVRELPDDSENSNPNPDPLAPKYLSVVTDIYGIFGYDFLHLDTANAGNETRVRTVSDSTLAALRALSPNPLEDGDQHMKPGENKPAAGKEPVSPPADPAALTDALKSTQDALLKSVSDLHLTVQEMAKSLTDKLAPAVADNPGAKSVAVAVAQVAAAAQAIHDDVNLTPDQKNTQLQEMSVKLSGLFSQTTGVPANAAAVAKLDSLKAANEATATLAESMRRMLADDSKAAKDRTLRKTFDGLLDDLGGDGFGPDDKTALRDRLLPRLPACTDDVAVKSLVEDAVALANMGRAKERLLQLGYKAPATTPNPEHPVIDTSGDRNYLAMVHLLHDSMVRDGFQPSVDIRTGKPALQGRQVHPAVQKMLDRWDKRHGSQLRRELEAARIANGGRISDGMLAADIDAPYTLVRTVLFEAYSDDIILGVVTAGTMEQDRDLIPITRWRRASTNRFMRVPNAKERNEIVVPELNPIPEGKLTTDYHPIDAKARKLRALMSEEFITRSRRRPELGGISVAAQNLVADIKRCLGQDIFYMMLKKALLGNAVAFTSAQDGNSVQTTYQVTHDTNQVGAIAIDPVHAVMIVPESLVVTVDSIQVPEWGYTTGNQGGGPGGVYFYTVDHAMGTITFADAAGNLLPPTTGTANVAVTAGKKAGGLNAQRFNLTPQGGVVYEDWINRGLFAVQNLAAAMPTASGYQPEFILQSGVTATIFQQARAYTPLNARNGFTADRPVRQGSIGQTAGLDHFASVLWPNNITIVGTRDATQYRVFEPLTLRGPVETRDEFGHPNAGKEWYSYQEDAMDVPIPEKLAVLVTYAT